MRIIRATKFLSSFFKVELFLNYLCLSAGMINLKIELKGQNGMKNIKASRQFNFEMHKIRVLIHELIAQ